MASSAAVPVRSVREGTRAAFGFILLPARPLPWPDGCVNPIARTWWAAVLLPCAAAGCPSQQPSRDHARPPFVGPGASPPAAQPVVTAGPLPPAAALPPGAGVIACGGARCNAKESTCVAMAGKDPRCVPRAERDGYARGGGDEDAVLDCDDDADCPAGEHCCAGQYWGGTGPHIHTCTKDRCMEAIACVAATGCPPNLACRPSGSWGDAHCEPAVTGVACGNRRCGGATPVCCWDEAKNAGRCIAEPGRSGACTGEDEGPVRCRGRADCGGYDCCRYLARATDCSGTCPRGRGGRCVFELRRLPGRRAGTRRHDAALRPLRER